MHDDKQDNIQNLETLLNLYGKREHPDLDKMNHAREHVMQHWQQTIASRKRSRLVYATMAASMVMALFISFIAINHYTTNTETPYIESVFLKGQVMISEKSTGTWKEIGKDSELLSLPFGHIIKTNDNSFASLTLSDHLQIRLNQNTIMEFSDPGKVSLITGEVYMDADNVPSNNLEVITKFGTVSHIGTRYSVKVTDNLLISVRNGRVELNNSRESRNIDSEKRVLINDSGIINESEISKYDSSWKWIQNAAEPFDSRNKSLHDYIIWFSHENGLDIHWNNNKTDTQSVQLSGVPTTADPMNQIKAVFLATHFNYEISQGVLSIL